MGEVKFHAYTQDKWGARPVNGTAIAETPILDHGHVALLATYGSDDLIVDAAQVSYGRTILGNGGLQVERAPETTQRLIRYLMRHRHTSPFEQAELTFYLRMPIFVCRQHIRHRTANVNEYSARYSELSDDFYVPNAEDIARQSTSNKQGRGEQINADDSSAIQQLMRQSQQAGLDTYKQLLNEYGVARELARVTTSVGTYTEMYWKCDLHNYFHFLKLRVDKHAQKEIRDLAVAMYECSLPFFPLSFAAWKDYVRDAYTLSASEIAMLRSILRNVPAFGSRPEWPANTFNMSEREYNEFRAFLDNLL